MPATSFKAGCLARRSSSGRAGSPSKSSKHEIVLDPQHLAEMIVAMNADAGDLEVGVLQID